VTRALHTYQRYLHHILCHLKSVRNAKETVSMIGPACLNIAIVLLEVLEQEADYVVVEILAAYAIFCD
jgi:diaminopimelate decarboxylase